MELSKHKQLAIHIRNMMTNIDAHSAEAANFLNIIQVHFCEKIYILDRPLMTESAIKCMMYTHRNGMKVLCHNPIVKHAFASLRMLGAILQSPFILASQIVPRKTHGFFVPWGVKITLPEQNDKNLARMKDDSLLYGPNPSELSNHLDWFETEDGMNTFTHHLLTALEIMQQEQIFMNNLAQDPSSIYQDSIDEWSLSIDQTDVVAKSPQNLNVTDYAPKPNQNVAQAYEQVMKSRRNRTFRHRQGLSLIYKQKLIKAMFKGLDWSEEMQRNRIASWDEKLFESGVIRNAANKSERWCQAKAINRHTAAKLLRYFCTRFLDNPNDKVAGEVACILWILLWCAQDENCAKITIHDVIDLSSDQVSENNISLQIGPYQVEVSTGVHELMLCLAGNAGKKPRRVFQNIKHPRTLERALKDACQRVLGETTQPVSPGAFLLIPHPFDGIRLTRKLREMVKNTPPLVPLRHQRHDIIKALRAASPAK